MIKKENNMDEYINDNYNLNELELEDKPKEDEEKNKPKNNESDNIKNSNTENEDEDSDKLQDIKQMGVSNMPPNSTKEIQCITIIGEIEGHFVGNPRKKINKI